MRLTGSVLALRKTPNGDKYCQANDKIDKYAEIVFVKMACGDRQVWHEQEVHDVSRQDGDQRVGEIHSGWF
jgi:hypothetical protein